MVSCETRMFLRPDWIKPQVTWSELSTDRAWAGGWARDHLSLLPAGAVLWLLPQQSWTQPCSGLDMALLGNNLTPLFFMSLLHYQVIEATWFCWFLSDNLFLMTIVSQKQCSGLDLLKWAEGKLNWVPAVMDRCLFLCVRFLSVQHAWRAEWCVGLVVWLCTHNFVPDFPDKILGALPPCSSAMWSNHVSTICVKAVCHYATSSLQGLATTCSNSFLWLTLEL